MRRYAQVVYSRGPVQSPALSSLPMSFSGTDAYLTRRLRARSLARAARVSRLIWSPRGCDSSPICRVWWCRASNSSARELFATDSLVRLMFLLDTNVFSQLMRERPHHHVQKFFAENPATVIWTCSIVVAELLFGVELMPSGRRQRMLSQAIEDMIQEDFRQQILLFNLEAARSYGKANARTGRTDS